GSSSTTSRRTLASKGELHGMCAQDDPHRREPFMNGAGMATLLFCHEGFAGNFQALTSHRGRRFTSLADLSACRSKWEGPKELSYVRKNTNQITPRMSIAKPVEAVSRATTDGPGSACRASVVVSTIRSWSLVVAIVTSFAGCHFRNPASPRGFNCGGQRPMTSDVPVLPLLKQPKRRPTRYS